MKTNKKRSIIRIEQPGSHSLQHDQGQTPPRPLTLLVKISDQFSELSDIHRSRNN